MLKRFVHNKSYSSNFPCLTHPMQSSKGLLLYVWIPMRLHEICLTCRSEIKPMSLSKFHFGAHKQKIPDRNLPHCTTRETQKKNVSFPIIAKVLKYGHSLFHCHLPIYSYMSKGRLVESKFHNIKRRRPEREYNTTIISLILCQSCEV